jgi:two-component system nitrate/nitrite response regulator NarL
MVCDKTRVVIVDDYPPFREGVVHLLAARSDTEVVGQGASAADAAALAAELSPDVLLLDLDLPGGGINAARSIALCCPAVKIVVLTVSQSEDDVAAARSAGVWAYVLKGLSGRELSRVVRLVSGGKHYISFPLRSYWSFSTSEAPSDSLSA